MSKYPADIEACSNYVSSLIETGMFGTNEQAFTFYHIQDIVKLHRRTDGTFVNVIMDWNQFCRWKGWRNARPPQLVASAT